MTDTNAKPPTVFIPTTRELLQKFERLEIAVGIYLELRKKYDEDSAKIKEIVKEMGDAYDDLD